MIEVRCYHSFEEAETLRQAINALNCESVRPNPFSTFEFFENYFRYDEYYPQGQGMRLWFLAAFHDDRLIGYLALKQVTHKFLVWRPSRLGFLIVHDTDRPSLVARAEQLSQVSEAFYVYLLGRNKEWSFLEFQQQDDSSVLFPPPNTVDIKAYLVRTWPSMENGTIHICWDTLHAYFRALSGKFRSNVSRQLRILLAAGDVKLLTSSDPAITPRLLDLFCRIESHSWKTKAHANIGRHPERVAYFKGLLAAHQPMRVSIQILLLDGIPIAGLINGAFMNGLYALHVVYDDRLSWMAPGSAMFLLGVRQAINGRYASYNLLSGFGYYKARWLAEITSTRTAQIYRAGGILYWRRVLGDFKRRIFSATSKQIPAQFNPTRRELYKPPKGQAPPDKNPALERSIEEREYVAALLAEIMNGQCELLSTSELAALMPFETTRLSGKKHQTAA